VVGTFHRGRRKARGVAPLNSTHPRTRTGVPAQVISVNAADTLWNDQGLYQARYQKTGSALIAISRALARNHPLGGDESEFLELYARMAAADADAFTAVWRDPTSYFWVRLAYEYVGNCLAPAPLSTLAESVAHARGTTDSKSALRAHLADFKRFVLALGIATYTNQNFVTPFEVALPFAIPSSRLVISGKGNLIIHALIDDHLAVTHDGKDLRLALKASSIDSLTVRLSPVAVAANCSLVLQPEAFNLTGLTEGEPLVLVPPSYQEEHLTLTAQALDLIHRHCPATFEHFRHLIRLIALKPSRLGDYSNISHSDLPGSFVVTVANDPYLMADFFIHEFHHNRFFFVEELGAFFTQARDNLMTVNDYYSPFREDLRPLHGIFHGLYVYLAVWRFYFAVYRSGETSGLQRAAVSEQVALISTQLAIAVSQLRRYARFSRLGAKLFEAMADESARIQAMTRDLRFPNDLPSISCSDDGVFSFRCEEGSDHPLTVQRAILKHAEKYDLHRQCENLDSTLRTSFALD
jgi:HEXXH motif-containing protein